jgi:hypothetical protein
MAYHSPLIISTSSLNPSFGTVAVGFLATSPVICALLAVAIAVCFALTVPVFLFIAVALAVCFTPCWAWFKSTYVRP